MEGPSSEDIKSKDTNSQGAENLAMGSQNATNVDKPDLIKEERIADVKEVASASASDHHEEIVFNPNILTEFKLVGSPEEIAVDEDNLRTVGLYLTDIVLPMFTQRPMHA